MTHPEALLVLATPASCISSSVPLESGLPSFSMEGSWVMSSVVSPAELVAVGCASFCPGKLLFCQQRKNGIQLSATYFEYPSWIVPKVPLPGLGEDLADFFSQESKCCNSCLLPGSLTPRLG